MTPQVHSFGSGAPVTLVAPGLAATPGEARIPASGLPGTRVVVTLPGHGDRPAPAPDYWTYSRVAADLAELADRTGATQAIGTSLGAGALLRVLAQRPDRFERIALLLPAALDRPRGTPAMWAFERLADAAEAGDLRELTELVAAELPPGIEVGDHVIARAAALARLAPALRALPEQAPLPDPTALSQVSAPVLVLAGTGDPLHPTEVARAVAAAFRHAELVVLDSPAPLLTHRREVRARLVDFLGASVSTHRSG